MSKKTKGPAPSLIPQARTPGQKRYLSLLAGDHDIIFADGPAGTGKTYLAVLHAISELRLRNCDRIVITRPNVEAGDPVGLLPGDLVEKMSPWMMPILDVFFEHYSVCEVKKMLTEKVIEIAPLAFMRGRTFKDAVIIGDEMQNSTPEQMKMFLTRIGDGSRMIVTGDNEQHDRGHGTPGLRDILERLKRQPSARIGTHTFHLADVVRHPVIKEVLTLYA